MTSISNNAFRYDSARGSTRLMLLVAAMLLGMLANGHPAVASIGSGRNPPNPKLPPSIASYQDTETKSAEPERPIPELHSPLDSASLSEANLLKSRMQTIGWCCLGLLGVLVVAFVYFRLNHATRGIYSRRLLMFAIMVSVFVILAVALTLQSLWR